LDTPEQILARPLFPPSCPRGNTVDYARDAVFVHHFARSFETTAPRRPPGTCILDLVLAVGYMPFPLMNLRGHWRQPVATAMPGAGSYAF